jgi:hypothetical protein
VAQAEQAVLPAEWHALTHMVDETQTLETIGRSFTKVSDRKIARRTGLMLVSTGLERLALLWGFQQRQKIPSRP